MAATISSTVCAILLGFIACTKGTIITCTFPSEPVYEGDSDISLSCSLQNIDTNYVVAVKRNGNEVTPRTILNTEGTYVVSNPRYTIRTTDLLERGDSTGIQYHLDISTINRDDNGSYDFEVLSDDSSSATVVTTTTNILTVYYLPDGVPSCSPEAANVVSGNVLPLLCTSSVGNPPDAITLKWSYQGGFPSGNIVISDETISSTLDFVSENDETANIMCITSFNQALFPSEQDRTCQAGPIQVITNPVLSVTPTILFLTPGVDASFTCVIENNPIATRTWISGSFTNDRFITSGDNDEAVHITNVQPDDSGTITCRVNTGGSSFVEESAELIVTSLTTTGNENAQKTSTTIEQTTEGTILSGKSEQEPLSVTVIVSISVCIAVLVLIIIIVAVVLLWKCRDRH